MKKVKKIHVPELTEYTDDDGQKWIQTSTEDLFSTSEINSILDTIEKEKDPGEVVLANINFQRVNKEYYDATIELQNKLKKQTMLLHKVIKETKSIIDKKNTKLKELITYVKKLHAYIAHLSSEEVSDGEIAVPQEILSQVQASKDDYIPVYEEVEETVLDVEVNEI